MSRLPFLLLFVATVAAAQADAGASDASVDRPSEDAMFGSPERASEDAMFQQSPTEVQNPGEEKKAATDGPLGKANAEQSDDARGDAVLSGPPSKDRFASGEFVDDPLKIGGQFYLRYFGNAVENTQFKNIAFSSPNLLDVYLDARPADRVRGFARFRMRFDPTYDPNATTSFSALGAAFAATNTTQAEQPGQDTGTPTVSTTTTAQANPSFVLDQLWLNFDILRTVYVTAGRQHIRWTVSRFWQPTDFLSPQLRDPLAVFDQRLGASALKLHFPIESLGWNFYAVTLLDNFGPANVFGELGQAFRGEFVLGPAELGLTSVFQRGRGPRYGLDVSSAVGPFDVYGEMSFRPNADRQMVRFKDGENSEKFEFVIARLLNQPTFDNAGALNLPYETFTPEGPVIQVTGGATYTHPYSDTDTFTLGLEYFYNQYGYADGNLFPVTFATGTYAPFYAGREYGGAYLLLLSPGPLDNGAIIVSTLGNLSDMSFLSRIDFSYRALSFLQLEAFAAYHYGKIGEFHFGFDLPPQRTLLNSPNPQLQSIGNSGILVPAPMFDFGVGARISL